MVFCVKVISRFLSAFPVRAIENLHQGSKCFRKKCFKGRCCCPDFYIRGMGNLNKAHPRSGPVSSLSSKNGIMSIWILLRNRAWWMDT